MDNDDKRTSRDDETPPNMDFEPEDAPDHGGKDDAFRKSAEAGEVSKGGADNTISFPKAKTKDGGADTGQGFGMPDFGHFVKDEAKGPALAGQSVADALTAARNGLESPPHEETGWQDADSIEKPPLSASLADMANSGFGANGDLPHFADFSPVEGPRSEATVMPFPGNPNQRSTEPDPSELLRGSGEMRGADLFGSGHGEPAEALPDFDPANKDSIADAVQSALRNVYGGASADDAEDVPDPRNYTVAESLRHAAAADTGNASDFWADSEQEWRDDRQDAYFEDGDGAPPSDADPDSVLDYLYGDRRGRKQAALPGETPLHDTGEAPGYERDWRGGLDYDERAARPGGRPEFGDAAYREPGRAYSARGGYEDEEPNIAEWNQPPYVSSSSANAADRQFLTPHPSANQESLAAGSPDSSHLLGAAGLGLIGGIALAGVLAVFVFNSFIEEGEPTVAADTPKVVERLDTRTAAAPQGDQEESPLAIQAEPAAAQPEPATEARIAATQPEPQPQLPAVDEKTPLEKAIEAGQKLYATDAIGQAGAPIRLDIQLTDAADQEATLISVKGLPTDAKLSTGIDVGGGQWLLPPSRLRDLTVTTAEGVSGGFELEAQLLRDDAQTPVSEPIAFRVRVAGPNQRSDAGISNTLPQPEDAALTITSSQRAAQIAGVPEETAKVETDFLTQMLIRDGNKLMRVGDILGARRLYEQAAANDNPEAALAMGRSFDPSYFEKLPVKTGKPDPATAFQWYKKALDGGLVTARVKIDGLKQWLQR
jgi:hypothetical protein